MEAPRVSSGMDFDEAKRKLQQAADKLAELYTEIGTLTIETVAKNPVFEKLVSEFSAGRKFLESITDDDIPF
jgi:hypothetical protein